MRGGDLQGIVVRGGGGGRDGKGGGRMRHLFSKLSPLVAFLRACESERESVSQIFAVNLMDIKTLIIELQLKMQFHFE